MESIQDIKKVTPTEYDILPIIKNRYSPRIFSDLPVSDTELHTLFEAGRWAPSSSNLQPWRIIWGVKGSEIYDRIYDCLDPFNQKWADNAPVLWINAYKKTMDNGKENFHALHDLGLFMGNVCVQAQQLGIAVHQMAGVKHEEAKKEFKLPEDFHVATGVAIGYYGGEVSDLPEDLQEMETEEKRSRMTQDEFTFNGDYVDRASVEEENRNKS